MFIKNRLERESKTLQAMFQLYCSRKHGNRANLCRDCQELQDYSLKRLQLCRFQQGKTTCANCPVHCYKPDMRLRIKQIMRYSGPLMLFYHPILTLRHYLDGFRKEPQEV